MWSASSAASSRTGPRVAVSTRDRALTPLQGPTAVAGHALRLASARGLTFDVGVVTPTSDPSHPHYSVLWDR